MEKQNVFNGIDPEMVKVLAKTQAAAQGISIRDYLAKLIKAHSRKRNKGGANVSR